MEKDWLSPDAPLPPKQPSLAEEQRRAFEEDAKRKRPGPLRYFPGLFPRN
jgi:hypothetical protein